MPRVREIEDDGGDPILKDIFAKEREIFGGVAHRVRRISHGHAGSAGRRGRRQPGLERIARRDPRG